MQWNPRNLVAVLILMVSCLPAQHGNEAADMVRGCVACHGLPDASLQPDRLWIGRIATTACVVPAAPKSRLKRDGLMNWLRSQQAPRPRLEHAVRHLLRGEGLVTVPFRKGSVLLMPAKGQKNLKPIRLAWLGDAEPNEGRGVPVGRYRVRNYKVVRKGANGVTWQIWASGKRGREVVVRENETSKLDLDLRVHLKPTVRARRKPKGALQVGIKVLGDSRMGLTVIRAGDRVPAIWTFVAKGRDLASGGMAYG